jgi:hypothetical protein
MPPSKSCGAHTELASNDAVRVTRCGCGTVHVTIVASGVTVRVSNEVFRGMIAGLKLAGDKLDDTPPLGGATIN